MANRVVDPAPKDGGVEGNLAPPATDMGDVNDGRMDRIVAGPGFYVKPRMGGGVMPEETEDVAEDFDREAINAGDAGKGVTAGSMLDKLGKRVAHESAGRT